MATLALMQKPVNDIKAMRDLAFRTILMKSFRRGSINLASGRISEYYLDMKPSMFDPAGSTAMARLVFERLQQVKVDCIGGLEMGAVPLISNVVMISYLLDRPLPGFFVRKAIKDHGTKQLVEGCDVKGKNVVIIDDVVTSGGSAMQAVDAVRTSGANVSLVLSVVDREEGAADLYRRNGLQFDRLFTAKQFMAASAANSPSTGG